MDRTANGVEIVDGLLAWNNNLDLCRVRTETTVRDGGFEGWYDTDTIMTYDGIVLNGTEGVRGPIMNGERLTTVHPFGSLQTAEDAFNDIKNDPGRSAEEAYRATTDEDGGQAR